MREIVRRKLLEQSQQEPLEVNDPMPQEIPEPDQPGRHGIKAMVHGRRRNS